jgi:integrase
MAVKVKEWKGAWWVFIDYQGRRKAKRVGSGKAGQRAALAAEVCLKPGTAEQYAQAFRVHWLPELGEVTLPALTREHVKMVLSRKLAAGLKPNTVKLLLSILRACLNAAMEDGLIVSNPAARVGKFIPRTGETSLSRSLRQQS